MDKYLILLVIVVLGLLSKNTLVWAAAALLLFLQLIPSGPLVGWMEQYGIRAGIAVLTLGVLAPIAQGKIGLSQVWESARSVSGILAVVMGLLVTYLGAKGTDLLGANPEIVTGLLIGTILGVALFGGVPVGPLIGAGILAFLLKLIK